VAQNAIVRARGIDVAAEVLESLPDPVIACDTEGTVVFWSRAAEKVYGYSAAEALGRRAATLLHTRFPVPLLEITEELADLGHWHGRLEHRAKDGRTVSVHRRWVTRHDEHGARAGSFAIEREESCDVKTPAPGPHVTEPSPGRGEPEPAGGAGPPARTLVHELNNALAIIINYTAFVTAELDTLPDASASAARQSMRADLQEVQAAAERALELIRGMPG
jgi:PAS domain S-box-containing protein